MTSAATISAHGWTGYLNQGLALRELECLLGIAGGRSNKQLAQDLDLQPDTIKKTVSRALFKLGAANRASLISEAFKRGLIGHCLVLLLAVGSAFGADPMAKVRRSGGSESKIETRIASKRHEVTLTA